MQIEDFINRMADQFDDTAVSEFRADTKFRELDEWSSLMALSIMAMIDEEYGVQVKADQMRGAQTIQELFDLVAGQLG